jgi:Cse1
MVSRELFLSTRHAVLGAAGGQGSASAMPLFERRPRFGHWTGAGPMQEFEKTLDDWMAQFHALLVYENAALVEADPERESALDAAKAAVCQNINLFMEMNEEVWGSHGTCRGPSRTIWLRAMAPFLTQLPRKRMKEFGGCLNFVAGVGWQSMN